jgi:hypothetical protein
VHFALDHGLAEIAVCLLDAAFGERAGVTEVLVSGAARPAARIGTGSAHGRDDEVARSEPLDGTSHLGDFRQRLVTHDQVVLALRRGAVLERADLPIGPADPDLEDPEHHVIGTRGDVGHLLEDADFARAPKGGERSHDPAASRSSALITRMTALTSARWEKACGKFPRWPPVRGSISSAYRWRGLAKESSQPHKSRARSSSPISAIADTSQNEQMVNVPSSPSRPSSISSTR